MNLSHKSLEFSQMALIFRDEFPFNQAFFLLTKRDPFSTGRVSKMASGSIIISLSALTGGYSTLALLVSSNFFFNKEI